MIAARVNPSCRIQYTVYSIQYTVTKGPMCLMNMTWGNFRVLRVSLVALVWWGRMYIGSGPVLHFTVIVKWGRVLRYK
jgi:hypothetical protein